MPVLYHNSFPNGYYPNKSPLAEPSDVAIAGSNMRHTDKFTWKRRDGFTQLSSNATATATDTYKNVFSFINNSTGGAVIVADRTSTVVRMPLSGANVSLFTKAASTNQCFFASIGSVCYITDSEATANHKKLIGTTSLKRWGITAPDTAPTFDATAGSGLRRRIGSRYAFTYYDSSDGHESSASPISENTLNFLDNQVDLTGAVSAESRVDKVRIYRTTDGGSTFFLRDTIDNTDAGGGMWEYTDVSTGAAAEGDDDLNRAIIAPLANVNDPPPDGMSVIVNHVGRIWGVVDNKVYYDGGAESFTGVPQECWPPLNYFEFNVNVTTIAPTSQGLLVFTVTGDLYVIRGLNPLEFYIQLLRSRIPVASPNCVVTDGDVIYIYTANSKIFRITDTVEEIGEPLTDTDLTTFAPSTSYLTVHRVGNDAALWLSDNASKLLRFDLTTETWSTPFEIEVTCGYVGSILTAMSSGEPTFNLLIAPALGTSGFLWYLDDTVNTDDGTAYTASLTFGRIFANPGETATFDSIYMEGSDAGTPPQCSILPQEISGQFAPLQPPVNDPYNLSEPGSYKTKRYWPNTTQKSQIMRYLQVKFDWKAEDTADELYSIGIEATPRG